MAKLKGNYPKGSKEEDDLIKMILTELLDGVDVEDIVDKYFEYETLKEKQEAVNAIKGWCERHKSRIEEL